MPAIAKREIDRKLREWERFASPSEWRRSARGNLWREWNGLIVTVFIRRDGWFGWCAANEDGPRYSSRGYELEEDAQFDLWEGLTGW